MKKIMKNNYLFSAGFCDFETIKHGKILKMIIDDEIRPRDYPENKTKIKIKAEDIGMYCFGGRYPKTYIRYNKNNKKDYRYKETFIDVVEDDIILLNITKEEINNVSKLLIDRYYSRH